MNAICAGVIILCAILAYLFWKSTLPEVVVSFPKENPLKVNIAFGPLPSKWGLPDLKSVLISVRPLEGVVLSVQITNEDDTHTISYFTGGVTPYYENLQPNHYLSHNVTPEEQNNIREIYDRVADIFLNAKVWAQVEYAFSNSNSFDAREQTKSAIRDWKHAIDINTTNTK